MTRGPVPCEGVPEISVVLPYRDAAPTIDEALRSILAQRGVALELIAVDDGSTDDGAAIVAHHARRDARVVSIRTDVRGIVGALDAGLRAAHAPLVARMDADDVAQPDRLARQRALFEEHRDTDVCATCVSPFAVPPSRLAGGMVRYCDWQNRIVTPDEHRNARFVESPVCHPSVVFRRALVARYGGYREGPFPEDYELWLRWLAAGVVFRKVPEPLHRWRVHAGQTTWRDGRYAVEPIRALKATWLAPELRARGKPVVHWGAGPTGTRLARALEPHGVVARAFVDVDPRKIGSTRRGAPVLPPESLERGRDTVLLTVGAAGARDRIREWLDARGFTEGIDYLCAA